MSPSCPFGRLAGLAACLCLAVALPAALGAPELGTLVPADKGLTPERIALLTRRGIPEVYQGADLEKIGMPVGGICAGQLYLGGDGRLWHWDVFNQAIGTGGEHYPKPMAAASPLESGLALRITAGGKTQVRCLDRTGFADVRFRGEYPIGRVEYRDPDSPIAATLEAFSPFVPLDPEDSGLPATLLHVALRNTSQAKVQVDLAAWLENAVCLATGHKDTTLHRNHASRSARLAMVECGAAKPEATAAGAQQDVLFEDFQKETWEGWETTGTAWGKGPVARAQVPAYQGDLGGSGARVANSHACAPGSDVGPKDAATGTLTSRAFTLERPFIHFWIGGGEHPGKTCVNLLVDGKAARTATGHNNNRMRAETFDVRDLQGKSARIQVVDDEAAGWGNIGIGEIVLSDRPVHSLLKLEEQPDYGTMALGLLRPAEGDRVLAAAPAGHLPEVALLALGDTPETDASAPFGRRLCSALVRPLSLDPGREAEATFVIAWHFPNLRVKEGGRYYASRFASAGAVAGYVAENEDRLAKATRLWRDTWYDTTLPYWFLDRTFANTSILASSTCMRLKSGRFYAMEGVGCCAGTCTHVWHYAQAVGRLFPQLERDLRERTDFGLAFDPNTGVIRFRGEDAGLAIDGQAGCILRCYREHLVSADDRFLKRNWPSIKKALQCLIAQDGNGDGLIEGAQHNTLDTEWYGPVAWLSGLYLAALRAGEEMATEAGDAGFAAQARKILEQGARKLPETLFNGEYFQNRPDPAHPEAVNSGSGCEIDQVMGQGWAFQVGLGRVLPEKETLSSLRALWKYSFAPDVGPFRKAYPAGRWFAMPGEGGLLMCTFPRPDWSFDKSRGEGKAAGFAGYFNECMSGFEHQVAGHMIWEGMVNEGLAIERAIHERYHPSRRNPWNEVECGDHYARAMASYGVFLAACGYAYHGPRGYLAFAPRLTPEDFRAAFTAAEGWGTLSQKRDGVTQTQRITLKWGKLRLKEVGANLAEGMVAKSAEVTCDGKPVPAVLKAQGQDATVTLEREVALEAGQELAVRLTCAR